MARKNRINTRLEIIQIGTRLFLENGFTATSAPRIASELGISTGNLTFHFPTKEHLLVVLVNELCDFQWKIMKQATDEGATSLLAFCLELTAMAAICEENENAKDFYISAYTHPMTLDIIRKNDIGKAKAVFGSYCSSRTEEEFAETENLVSGIEYATLMTTSKTTPLELRIAGALSSIMMLYNVPEELRDQKIKKVLSMDYRGIGRKVLREFAEYIDRVNEDALREVASFSK